MKNVKNINSDARWTPALRGKIYCSPACGGGCTKADHDRTVKRAAAVVRRMKADGWSVRIWENLGWHYSLLHGPVSLYEHPGMGFSCMISQDLNSSGSGFPPWTEISKDSYFKDPNDSVKDAVSRASTFVSKLNAVLFAASQAADNPEGALMSYFRALLARSTKRPDASMIDRELSELVLSDVEISKRAKRIP